MTDREIRILVVDDSALYRQLVRNVLREVPGVEVVGAASSGLEALEMVRQLHPDLLTLDVRMPEMDGLQVLRELKQRRLRAKALMLSSLTANGAQVTTDALLEGAFDFIHKPGGPDAVANRKTLQAALAEKIQGFRDSHAMRLRPRRLVGMRAEAAVETVAVGTRSSQGTRADEPEDVRPGSRYDVVVIATSTGGPVALREVLPLFPGDLPVPILIIQHMPAQYTHSLAERLNEASQIEVVEAVDGMPLEPGWAYIAPGGRHMKVGMQGSRPLVRVTDDPPVNNCRPAADYLFSSVADVFEGRVLAVIMTGMGRDGAEGCRELKKRGGFVITQHPEGCVVYGMPKVVVDENLSDLMVPLDRIAATVARRVRRGERG